MWPVSEADVAPGGLRLRSPSGIYSSSKVQQFGYSRTQSVEWLAVFVLGGEEEKLLVKMYDL